MLKYRSKKNLSLHERILFNMAILLSLIIVPSRSVANPSKDIPVERGSMIIPATSATPESVSLTQSPTDLVMADNPIANTVADNTNNHGLHIDDNGTQDNSSPMGQVTSVSQLADVQPTDWAFQALQSLVERYGCIAGYPNSTYQGNRALTRFEFAAGLNACLDRVSELISAGTNDFASKQDLATLQRLQEEFATELAVLRGRVDALETRTATLEANQFSTTTKLRGEAIFLVADAFGDRANNTPTKDTRDDTQTFLSYRVRLTLQTSFNGKDQLTTGLQAINVPVLAATTGTQMTRLAIDPAGGNAPPGSLFLDRLYYRFPVGQQATVWIGARALQPIVFTPTLNPLIGGLDGAVSRFAIFNHTVYRPGFDGAGAAVAYKFNNQLQLNLGYIADDSRVGNPGEGNGLFNGNHLALAQVTYTPSDTLGIGFTYVRKYFGSGTGFNLTGGTGSAFARNPFEQNATASNNFGLEFNWKASPAVQIGGWFGYTLAERLSGGSNNATILHGALTLAFPDLFSKGNLGGFVIGVPPKATSNDYRPTPGAATRQDLDTSLHLEVFYTFRVNDNISVTPDVYVITSPEHNSANETIWVGALRTNFTF